MKAYVFPGQGAQFPGMGKDLFESKDSSKKLFELSNDILGFNISEIMFKIWKVIGSIPIISIPVLYNSFTCNKKINAL